MFTAAFRRLTQFNAPILFQEVIFSSVGETATLGTDVAISGDGMYLAAGAPFTDLDGIIHAGYVRLYAKSGTDWNLIQQINGTQSDDKFGWSLDLSHNGSMLTVGSSHDSVSMFELSDSTFLYELFHTIDDINTYKVAISGDGMVIGVTSRNSSIGARIFERIDDGFQQRGTDILGYGYYSGIAMNYDGTIAIVGDYAWPNSTRIGRAAVFQLTDNKDGSMEWMQMGSDITGDAARDELGWLGCVAITYDGLTVAVGAEGSNWDEGLVRVYNYNVTEDTWKQSGSDLVGDNRGDEFSKTAFSSDGTYLAVGAYDSYDSYGYVKIFEKIGNSYEMVGDLIISESEGGVYFGWSVDLSADGSTLAIGDWGFDNAKGRIHLYDTFTSSPTIPYTITPTESSSLPPSMHESIIPTALPTVSPSIATFPPTKVPSYSPSKASPTNPTRDITNPPSKHASNRPTLNFITHPSDVPSAAPIIPKHTALRVFQVIVILAALL